MHSKCIRVIALSIALFAAGCHKNVPIAVLQPVPPPGPGPTPNPPPMRLPAQPDAAAPKLREALPLEQADSAFREGDYKHAQALYEDAFNDQRSEDQRDRILLTWGLALVFPPDANWRLGSEKFKQLIDSYQTSPYTPLAHLILSLRSEIERTVADKRQAEQRIKQLTTELDRLKKIDTDPRRRP